MRWTLKQVAEAVAGKPGSGVDAVARVAGVSIDSRTIRRGELFFAIHGPRNDGHDYVADVVESGALAQWWRNRWCRATRAGYRTAASPCPTRSQHSTNWREQCARTGARKFAGSPGRSENHYKRDPGGIAGREAPGPENRRKF